MMFTNRQTTEEIARSREVLETARQTLHAEFIGVDDTIDAIIRDISPWFLFPDLLSRPTVINLWGMTGVGKTSLVNRLVELIGFQRQYFRFDLGDKSSSLSFHDSYATLAGRSEELPMIVAFDEVHHARSLDGFGNEESDDRNRPMWELLDSGTVRSIEWCRNYFNSWGDLADKLEDLLAKGVRIENGEFVTGLRQAEQELNRNFKREKSRLFIQEDAFDAILRKAGKDLGITLKCDLEKHLQTLSGREAPQFIRLVDAHSIHTVVKKFQHLLIFVMGNLDEVFTMSGDFSADRDADLFYRLSLDITIPQVKNALKRRFRSEQIARLGNTHIIFPAVRRESFERVIAKELESISHHVSERFDITLEFDESVHRLVYDEGVYPTQGYRPLFSTVHQLLKGNIGTFLSDALASPVPVTRMFLFVEGKQLVAVFSDAAGSEMTKSLELALPLTDLRQCTLDDRQAVTAVHESGHAVIQMVLAHIIPNAIHSVTSDHDNNGFMTREGNSPPTTRQIALSEAAVLLGGFAAEKLVFGSSGVTGGSASDMARATELVCRVIKHCGMGSRQMFIESWTHNDEKAVHVTEVEQEIADVLKEALDLAEKTLKSEWRLLLELADFLSDHRVIEQDAIRSMCRAYSTTGLPDSISAGVAETGQRRRLKQIVADLDTDAADSPPWPPSLEKRLRPSPPPDLPLAAGG